MALRLTDMLDMPLEPESARETSRRGAQQPADEKTPRVRWAEIGDDAQPAPSTALDPKKFEEPPSRVAPAAASKPPAPAPAATPAPAPAPAPPAKRRFARALIPLALLAAAAVAVFLYRPMRFAAHESAAAHPVSATSVVPAPPQPTVEAPSSPEEHAAPQLPPAVEFGRALATGQSLLKKGRYRAAVTELRRAVELEPDSVPALLALGDAFLEADQARSALTPLQKAAQIDRRSGRAQLLLGTAHQTLGHRTDALRAYRRYLELEPKGEFAGDVRAIVATLSK
jgi:tetratricopeptide (TPR) repeat protein